MKRTTLLLSALLTIGSTIPALASGAGDTSGDRPERPFPSFHGFLFTAGDGGYLPFLLDAEGGPGRPQPQDSSSSERPDRPEPVLLVGPKGCKLVDLQVTPLDEPEAVGTARDGKAPGHRVARVSARLVAMPPPGKGGEDFDQELPEGSLEGYIVEFGPPRPDRQATNGQGSGFLSMGEGLVDGDTDGGLMGQGAPGGQQGGMQPPPPPVVLEATVVIGDLDASLYGLAGPMPRPPRQQGGGGLGETIYNLLH